MSEEYPGAYRYKQLVQAKLFIDSHYSERIDIENIANQAYFSKFHFLRRFKAVYGKTPHQYLTAVRIEKARESLGKGLSVQESCYQVGFESITTFIGLFKRYEKCTPGEYRQRIQRKKQEIKIRPLKFIPNCFAEQKGWNKMSNIEEVI